MRWVNKFWTWPVALGLIALWGEPASAFFSVSPGQSPEQAMELHKTNIVRDFSTNTYYVRRLRAFCTLRQIDYAVDAPEQTAPRMLGTVATLGGSCTTPASDPLLDPRLYPPGVTPKQTVPVRAMITSMTEMSASSDDLGYSEQLFEMMFTDAPDATRMCAVAVHVKTPTGRSLFVERDFMTTERCGFDTVIVPMVQ